MEKSLNIDIYEPPSTRRYWVVKADAGKYYDLFIANSVIAIGHLNKFSIKQVFSNPFVVTPKELKDGMTTKRDGKTIFNANNYGQVNSFINEMNIGDWVITKTSKTICIGLIISPARLDDEIVTHTLNKGLATEREQRLDFMLKRSVSWGPVVSMSHLPTDLYISLRSPMTLYNVDRHMESLHHTLYPFFKINDSLHFSVRINQDSDISNYYLSKVFDYLNELEFLAQVDLDNNDLNGLYENFLNSGGFNLSTKADFHSAGDIWAKVKLSSGEAIDGITNSRMTKAILIYSMLFGNQTAGIDGVLDIDTRHKIRDILIERIDMNTIGRTVEKLELTMPKYNTQDIEKKDDC